MATTAARRVQGRPNGTSSSNGKSPSVASAPQDRARDSQSVMCGRIQTANQVTIRSWWST